MRLTLRSIGCVAAALTVAVSMPLCAQDRQPMGAPNTAQQTAPPQATPQRTRLILKDGSYQVVLSYKLIGSVVRYRSAERNDETEDVPLALVDLPATESWARGDAEAPSEKPPVLSPELAREEAARRALTPEIAPDLFLPEEDSMLALDTFRGTPELVPILQAGDDLNKETTHPVLKEATDPASSARQIIEIPGAAPGIQMHAANPVFYVHRSDDVEETDGEVPAVDIHEASDCSTAPAGASNSRYVIERVDVRQDSRVLDNVRAQLDKGRNQPGVIEMKREMLAGGHWMKLTLDQPLELGEYVLIEVISCHGVRLNVWDFGVHPDAKENAEAIRPEAAKSPGLERRDKK